MEERQFFKEEVKHVKEFFSKKPLESHCEKTALTPHQLREMLASHQFLLLKSLVLLQLISPFKKRSSATKPVATRQETATTKKEAGVSSFLENSYAEQGTLQEKRVHGWHFKEALLARLQLKILEEAYRNTKQHAIAPFLEQDLDQEAFLQTQEWQDQLSSKEERHFQVSHITKILSP